MGIGRPADAEFAPYYGRYVSLVPGENVVAALETQADEIRRLSVAPEREGFRYAPGKWSVREVVGHLVDAERVFGYRAFCISRGEEAALPSFDENAYVARSRYGQIPVAELVRELLAVRETTLTALRRLDEPAWLRRGTASGKPVSARALAYIMAGHVSHHRAILNERYGID